MPNHGGVREGAGRPHEHTEYVTVEVVDFYGDEDNILVGPYLDRKGGINQATLNRARAIGRYAVTEQSRSVLLVKAKCCISQFSREVLERVTEGVREDDWKFNSAENGFENP